ncbi:MAG: hypothetical protein GTN78_22470 [Gemmatimonadales bacterium]|nr:hypothetical protein [Gemmatimonadales bacterium]NIR02932.1 hypothetical protein [Gemmatimonadales bacterium]
MINLIIVMAPLIAISAAAPAADPRQDTLPTVEQIVERYIEAVGGRDAIERLTTRVCTGRFIDDRPYRGPVEVFPLEVYSEVPGRWLLVQHFADGTYRDAFDGRIGWRQNPEGIERAEDNARSKHGWLFDPQGPLRIRDYFRDMVVTGTGDVDGQTVYVVQTDRDHAHYSLYFDIETGLLLRIGYWWWLEDYREVDGVKVPFRIVCGRKGGSNTYEFDRVEHNLPIDHARFVMPDSSGALGGA